MQTILLIENDPATLVAQSLILRCFGYNVLEAANRGEVWRACRHHRGPIHLVMMKAGPDEGSTRDLVARLQLIYPKIRAVIVSEASPPKLANMPCEYALLQRPFRVAELANVVKGLLEGVKIKIASAH